LAVLGKLDLLVLRLQLVPLEAAAWPVHSREGDFIDFGVRVLGNATNALASDIRPPHEMSGNSPSNTALCVGVSVECLSEVSLGKPLVDAAFPAFGAHQESGNDSLHAGRKSAPPCCWPSTLIIRPRITPARWFGDDPLLHFGN
jgi:hypothetical protein